MNKTKFQQVEEYIKRNRFKSEKTLKEEIKNKFELTEVTIYAMLLDFKNKKYKKKLKKEKEFLIKYKGREREKFRFIFK